MTPKQYLDTLPEDRREVISKLREYILKSDPLVKEVVGGMMGREMLVYMQGDLMKYALSCVKQHMSFHSMVMYYNSTRFGGSGLRETYEKLLPKANFRKAVSISRMQCRCRLMLPKNL
jgi:fructose-1,6-bisphosphatase